MQVISLDHGLFTALIVSIHIIVFLILNLLLNWLIQQNKKCLGVIFSLQISKVVVITSLLIVILLRFGFVENISGMLITGSSLLVAVLGFAAQESLNNVLSGIMIAKSKPFEIGQRIVIEEKNITGTVVGISLRHTVIRKINNATVIIPNSVMNTVVIENSSYDENIVANFLDITIDYYSDINEAIMIITEVVSHHPFFIDGSDPCVLVRSLGLNGYCVRATVWTSTVAKNFEACSDIRIELKKQFDEAGIEIAYGHVKVIS